MTSTEKSQSHHESNRKFYDRISQAYDLIADAGEHKARQAGEAALEVRAGESVLEIGFGTGNSLLTFANQVGDTGSLFGIDISDGMLRVAQTKVIESGLDSRVHLSVGDARELPYESDFFDAVFTSFTLELFPLNEIVSVLAEVKRVLKPGGRIGIVSMSKVREGEHPSMLENAYVWMHRHFPHLVDCQPIDVPGYLAEAGMRIVSQDEIKIWTMPVAIIVATDG